MVRLVIYLLSVLLIASGLGWLADNPGTVHIEWLGRVADPTVFTVVLILISAIATAILLWSIARAIWNSPAVLGDRIVKRRQKRGLEALSSGMIAVGAGDRTLATRYALAARKALPHEPLTHLLRAQAAQLSGDRATTRRIYEAMLASPETEQLGLRGLFLEAEREGETEAATQFAGRALKTNPKLGWSTEALFDLQCKRKEWGPALETLSHAKRNGHLEKTDIERKRAVLLTARAQDLEENETDKALAFALEAHALAPDLVAASAVAGRILAARGSTGKAAKIIQKTWIRAPHPDIATAYAYARTGDSTRDRLERIRQLAALNPQSIEGPVAVATTAIEARLFGDARKALEPLLANRLTQRVAILMARIEAGDNGDKGRVREWLARASNAARDPVWFADGVISNRWEAVSPVNGRLDAYQWRVPAEALDKTSTDLVANRIEELLAIGGPSDEHALDKPAATSVLRDVDAGVFDAEAVTVVSSRQAAPLHRTRDEPAGKIDVVFDTTSALNAKKLYRAPDAVIVPAKPAAAKAVELPGPQSPRPQPAAKSDPTIYVTPRAPDDPGLDDVDDLAPPYTKRPFRAVK